MLIPLKKTLASFTPPHESAVGLFLPLSVCLSVCLPSNKDMSVCLSVCMYVCLSVCPVTKLFLSVCLSVCMYVCLSVCLSVCPVAKV